MDPSAPKPEQFIEIPLAAQTVRLRRRTWRARIRLRESARAWHKELLADALRLAGVDGEAMVDRLLAADRAPLTGAQFLDYINSEAGQYEALEIALGGQPQADPEPILEAIFEAGLALDLVARLWDLELIAAPAAAATEAQGPGEAPDPLPPTPPAGPTGTPMASSTTSSAS